MLTIDLMFNLQIKSKTGGNLQTLGVHLKGFLFVTCCVHSSRSFKTTTIIKCRCKKVIQDALCPSFFAVITVRLQASCINLLHRQY